MNTSEKFCLKWNDFSDNLLSTFTELRTDQDLMDVTLTCEDGTQIESHKIVLSAGSLFFRNLLKKKKKYAMIIYMRGLKRSDLEAILDFLYHGEVSIPEKELNCFMSLAEELQLKGLAGGAETNKKPNILDLNINTNTLTRRKQINGNAKYVDSAKEEIDPTYGGSNSILEESPAHFGQIVQLTDNDDLKQKMTELVGWNGETWSCTVCGKLAAKPNVLGKSNLKRHTQTHMEGLTYPCNLCGKEFRSDNQYKQHMYRSH